MIWARSRGWIGVDIGSSTVKALQLDRRGPRAQIRSAIVVRRQTAWAASEDEALPTSLGSCQEVETALSSEVAFQGRAAAAVLPMSTCDLSELQIPQNRAGDAAQFVREEHATTTAASSAQEVAYWETGASADGEPTVIAVSHPHDWSRQVVRDLAAARLETRVLDALPLTLLRALRLGQYSDRNPLLAVDWGFQRALLCVVLGGRVRFVRVLRNTRFEHLVEAVCNALSVRSDEAQKLLTVHGLPHPDEPAADLPQVLADVTADAVSAFVAEATRTIDFLRQQRRWTAEQLVLFGGGATVKHIDHYLSHKLQLRAERWRMPAAPRFSGRWQVPPELLGPAAALSALAWSPTALPSS